MVPIIATRFEQLEALCKKYQVQRLWVFGSVASGAFDERASDVDLVVDFADPVGMSVSDQYFDLLEELESLFSRRVDLVELSAIRNPIFAELVEQTKRLLYAA